MSEATETIQPPPCDLDAEGALLSHCLLHQSIADAPAVHPKHFYADANGHVFRAMVQLNDEGKPVDEILVLGLLRDAGRLPSIGGSRYLTEILRMQPATTSDGAKAYAERILECYRRRRIIAALQTASAALRSGELSAADAWERVKEECRATP